MARVIAIYQKKNNHVVITLPATDKKCSMDSFPRSVPAVQFHNCSPSVTEDTEICQSYMTPLSSHNITYVLVQWSPLQR